jgi:hypothetical protein
MIFQALTNQCHCCWLTNLSSFSTYNYTMTTKPLNMGTMLPPPVATILFYASDGLAVRARNFSPSGRPRTPERIQWAEHFRKLVETAEGLEALKSLAAEGMQAWGCSAIVLGCLDAAFRDVTFRARAIAVLEELADTARERFSLSSPAIYPPEPNRQARPNKSTPGSPSPTRPTPRPHRLGRGPE